MKKEEYYKHNQMVVIATEQWIERIIKLIPNTSLKILDVGCAEGTYSSMLKTNKKEVWGIEISKEASISARNRIDKVITQNSEKKWNIPSNFFDTVTMLRYLEHVFDYNFQLQEARRVLKKNGSLIIFSPNISILERIRLLFGQYPRYADDIEHIREFTKPFLLKILKENNFDSIHCEGWGFMIPKIKIRIKILEKTSPNLCPCLIIKAIKK